jgi:hypothetical protein
MRISIQYLRDNARETSQVAVNGAKMVEETTHLPNTGLSA